MSKWKSNEKSMMSMQTLSLSDHKVYSYSDLSRSFIQNGLPNHQEEESAIKREWLLYGPSSSLERPPPVPTHQLQLLRTPRKSGSHCLVSSAARAWPKNADPPGGPPQAMEPQIQCALTPNTKEIKGANFEPRSCATRLRFAAADDCQPQVIRIY